MKAKFFTLAIFAMLSFSFLGCTEEEVLPAVDETLLLDADACECEGGIIEDGYDEFRKKQPK
jgi:hypothetical protein